MTIVAAIVTVYFVVPWETRGLASVTLRVAIALVILVGATVMAVRHVLRAEYPVLRAVEALAVVVTLAIVTFASIYSLASSLDVDAFSEPLDQVGALYFALTTATTVGFGDIHPRSDVARVVVMVQMLTNVVVLGAAARILLNTARRRVDG